MIGKFGGKFIQIKSSMYKLYIFYVITITNNKVNIIAAAYFSHRLIYL